MARIPVNIVTGFLGAGKSTLLNRLLKSANMADTAVIINEFGEVGIDHLLVESSGDSVVELSNGCLCCTVRGELADTLADFQQRMESGRIRPLRRIVIETTGLADPGPVIQTVIGHPDLSRIYDIDSVITLVDAVNGFSTLDRHEEARRQAAFADRLLISKLSLADAEAAAQLTERLRNFNPRAELIDADSARAIDPESIFAGLWGEDGKLPDVARWLNEGHHHDHICGDHCEHDHGHSDDHQNHHEHSEVKSFSIVHDRPIDPAAISMFVDLLRSAHSENMLRMKAVVQLSDDPDRPLVLHGVQAIFHPPERLPRWPDSDRRSRLVLITTPSLSEDFVRGLFDAFTGKPSIDRPDRQALEDNPLAIPGMKF